MADEYVLKNLSEFDPLPSDLVDADIIHANREEKDYKAPASQVLKPSDIVDDLTDANSTKPPSANSANKNYLQTIFNNRTDALLFTFSSIWAVNRNDTQNTITIPSGSVVDVNSALKRTFTETVEGTIDDGGGIVINIGTTVSWDFVNDISTIVEGADPNKFVVVKNIGGILKSRIPTIADSLYAQKTSVTDLSWEFDVSTVEGNPGAGKFRMNSITPANVTELYFSKESFQGIDVTNVLNNISDGTELQVIQISNVLNNIIGESGTIDDMTGYVTVPITITDSGNIFDSGAECSTTLYYEEKESVSDITRVYQIPTVSTGQLTIDFTGKNEVWATKTGGGGIVVNEDISIINSNDSAANTSNVFINVTSATRVITFNSTILCNDSRYNSSTFELTLPVGSYLLRTQFNGSNSFLEVLAEIYGTAAGEFGIVYKFNNDIGDTDPGSNYMKFDNPDLSIVTWVNISNIMNDIDISTLIENLGDGMPFLAYQSEDTTKFIVANINGSITANAGYYHIPLTVVDSGTIFDTDAICSTNFSYTQAGSGGGHTIQEQQDEGTPVDAVQQNNLLFRFANNVASIFNNVANLSTDIILKFRGMNDYDATGENAGDVISVNSSGDGYVPVPTIPDTKLQSVSQENINTDELLNIFLEHGYSLMGIRLVADGTNAPGTINIGTTSGGSEIASVVMDATFDETVEIKGRFYDAVNDQDLYISGITAGTVEVYIDEIFGVLSDLPSGGSSLDTFASLVYASTVEWDASVGLNKKLDCTGSFILSITNLQNGMSGDLRINASVNSTITLPSGSDLNGDVVDLNGDYDLTWTYDGVKLRFNIADYTTV